MILGIKLLLGLAALVLPGELMLRWLAPASRWGWSRPLIAFGIGQGVATWCLWVLGMAGVPMWSWGMGIILIASAGGLCLLRHARTSSSETTVILSADSGPRGMKQTGRKLWDILPWVLLAIASWVIAVQAAEEALRFRIGSVPGMGNWAYKTKLLLLTEKWPLDFFEYEAVNRRMGYPPGFPLLCGWCAVFMGGLETHAIRLLSVLLTIGTFILAGSEMIRLRRWWGMPGVAGLMALLLSRPGRDVLSGFYAEPLLLFTAAVTMILLARCDRHIGATSLFIVSAGTIAWVKNEGVAAFLLLTVLAFVFAKRSEISRKRIWMATICVALTMIVPWRIYLATHGWHDESFEGTQVLGAGNWDRLCAAWNEYRKAMYRSGSQFGGAWWLLPVLLWGAWRMQKSVILPVTVFTAAGWVGVAIVMMMGSVEENFEWHLEAASRVLLCPSLLLLMGFPHLGESLHIKRS